MSITNKIIAAFSFIAFSIGLIAFMAVQNADKLQKASASITQSFDTIDASKTLLSSLKDAETGQRGFLLTNNPDYLEPYNKALQTLPNDIKHLRELTADSKVQSSRVDTLEDLKNRKIQELGQTIALAKANHLPDALALVKTNKGKLIMDDFRKTMQELHETEHDKLDQTRKEAKENSDQVQFVITVALVAGLILLIATAYALNRAIVDPLRRQREERRRVTSALSDTISKLGTASAEILQIVAQGASGAQEQAAAVAETVSTVAELSQTSNLSAQQASQVAATAKKCDVIGKTGKQSVEETVKNMSKLDAQSETMADSIVWLAEQAHEIGDIIALVDDIAEQTNILSLNAAIEASRAGEHGRGFTVVANEVKTLADQSKKATAKVRQILGQIQKATQSTVDAAAEGSKTIDYVSDLARDSGDTINSLVSSLEQTSEMSFQIAGAAAQQATAIEQIQQAIHNINDVTKQNLAATRKAERTAQDLSQVGSKLQELFSELDNKAASGDLIA